MKVAMKAPTIPSAVVSKNPFGLFGPGESQRAIRPAMKPTMTTQMILNTAISLNELPEYYGRRKGFGTSSPDGAPFAQSGNWLAGLREPNLGSSPHRKVFDSAMRSSPSRYSKCES